eukprot:TRINITY_DN6559_c0_g1_i1.p1 TRINITY_DN6559_c0_g1~~TRINITY_DN6559_c0_g1_i1.p1  ORF type:complete len:168 (-),score=40.86 TRINITY_DN6559_c0_g1_i1:126-587(-)
MFGSFASFSSATSKACSSFAPVRSFHLSPVAEGNFAQAQAKRRATRKLWQKMARKHDIKPSMHNATIKKHLQAKGVLKANPYLIEQWKYNNKRYAYMSTHGGEDLPITGELETQVVDNALEIARERRGTYTLAELQPKSLHGDIAFHAGLKKN